MDLSQTTLTPLPGGWSGRTFMAEAAGERCVVRIYPPGADGHEPEVDAALLRLVRGLVPVPEVLDVRPAVVALDQPGLLVTEWVPGLRGDEAVARRSPELVLRMAAALGGVAGTLAGMPTLHAGMFRDAHLALEAMELDLAQWVARYEPALRAWQRDEIDGLRTVVDLALEVEPARSRTCLVHSDLNPKNVLVGRKGEVAALVDWEFAHSGSPWTDLGNVLRFDRHPGWVEAATGAYADVRGGDASVHLDRARAADLWALVDLAARPAAGLASDRADTLLRAIARTRDLHAWPDDWEQPG